MKQSGFAPVLIVLIVAVTVLGGYWGWQKYQSYQEHKFRAQLSKTEVVIFPKAFPSASTTSAETKDWKTYTSKDRFFSVSYPSFWYQYGVGNWVAFASKPESENGWLDLKENDFAFSVEVDPNSDTDSTGWYVINKKFPPDRRYIGSEYADDYEMERIISLPTIDNNLGFELERYSLPGFEGGSYYERIIYIVKDNKIVIISPFSYPGKDWYVTKVELFNQILSTFKLTQ